MRGVFVNQCYDELALRAPNMLLEIHRPYVRAGAEVIESSSFGASRLSLRQYGIEEQVTLINTRAVQLALDAEGERLLVAGAVGLLSDRLDPFGSLRKTEAREIFAEQMRASAASGADCSVLETFADLDKIEQSSLSARDVNAAMPILAQMTIGLELRTAYCRTPADIARTLVGWGPDVIGLNSSVGPQTILDAIE